MALFLFINRMFNDNQGSFSHYQSAFYLYTTLHFIIKKEV